MTDATRLGWIDAAKGIAIILVVLAYSTASVGVDTGSVGFMHFVSGFAAPFALPAFFFLSGLLLVNVITLPLARFLDRRVAHYLYFYLIWVAIHLGVVVALGEGDPAGAAWQFAVALVEPYGALWLVYMLALFGLVAGVVRRLNAPNWLVLTLAACLQIAAIDWPSPALVQFAGYFVYFYAGYLAAPFVSRFVDEVLALPQLAIFALGGWAMVNGALVFAGGSEVLPEGMAVTIGAMPGVSLVLGFGGAFALCAGAALLARLPQLGWLVWLGRHWLVVCLASALPVSGVAIASINAGFITEPGFLSLICFFAGVLVPVLFYRGVKWAGFGHFLFERPVWAHLPGTIRAARIERVTRPFAAPAE